jgi:mono/diheme cytochrome c family protein
MVSNVLLFLQFLSKRDMPILLLLFNFFIYYNNMQISNELALDGAKLYKTNCRLCHGKKGARTFNGAKDISKSKLSLEDRINIITNGVGTMAPFGESLSKKEIKAIAKYTLTLSKTE